MKRVLLLFLAATGVASAESRHVLVLRAEGNADAGARSKVDTQVLKLAKNIEGNVEAGDISYADATMAAGCPSPTDPACKDEVLATMGADEIVVSTVSNGPGGELKVSVKRLAKGSASREASTTVPGGQPPDAKMNADIGPMFGLVGAPKPAPVAETHPAPMPTPPAPLPPPSGT